MKTNIEQAVEILNEKFKSIPDFKLLADNNNCNGMIEGGFYWTPFLGRNYQKYPLHEVFMKGIIDWNIENIVDYASKIIIKNLENQKKCDEQYAKNYDKPVSYKYDYYSFGL